MHTHIYIYLYLSAYTSVNIHMCVSDGLPARVSVNMPMCVSVIVLPHASSHLRMLTERRKMERKAEGDTRRKMWTERFGNGSTASKDIPSLGERGR